MNEQDMMQKLKSDPRVLKSVMQSADGRALLGMLSGGDTAALGRAAQQAAAGNTSALSAMLQQVLSRRRARHWCSGWRIPCAGKERRDAAWPSWMKN